MLFFDKAIIASAESQVAKFMAFTMWKNCITTAKRIQHRLQPKIQKLFHNSSTIVYFRAWRTFVKDSIHQRMHTEIDTLSKKITALEKYIEISNADKLNLEYTVIFILVLVMTLLA